jgi:hypothetical protein
MPVSLTVQPRLVSSPSGALISQDPLPSELEWTFTLRDQDVAGSLPEISSITGDGCLSVTGFSTNKLKDRVQVTVKLKASVDGERGTGEIRVISPSSRDALLIPMRFLKASK